MSRGKSGLCGVWFYASSRGRQSLTQEGVVATLPRHKLPWLPETPRGCLSTCSTRLLRRCHMWTYYGACVSPPWPQMATVPRGHPTTACSATSATQQGQNPAGTRMASRRVLTCTRRVTAYERTPCALAGSHRQTEVALLPAGAGRACRQEYGMGRPRRCCRPERGPPGARKSVSWMASAGRAARGGRHYMCLRRATGPVPLAHMWPRTCRVERGGERDAWPACRVCCAGCGSCRSVGHGLCA